MWLFIDLSFPVEENNWYWPVELIVEHAIDLKEYVVIFHVIPESMV